MYRLANFITGKGNEPTTASGYLVRMVSHSPLIMYLLDQVVTYLDAPTEPGEAPRKLMLIEESPLLAYYTAMVLQFIGIRTCHISQDLVQEERNILMGSFNSRDEGSVAVLVCTQWVGNGANLHESCNRCIVMSQSRSLAMQNQATHRIVRVSTHLPLSSI